MAKSEPPTHQHNIKVLMKKTYKPENDLLLWLMTFSFLNNLNNFQTIINNKIELGKNRCRVNILLSTSIVELDSK